MAKSLASHISSKGRSRQLVQSRLGIQYVFSLNVGKKLYTFIRENERSILLRKMSHRLENFGNILNEPSVETSMTEKTPNTLYDGGMRSLSTRSGYQQKDRKPSQNDKTEHGMEKNVQKSGKKNPKCSLSESIHEESGKSNREPN
ncbi:hypothetical protein Tco_1114463 [Tanacetum coccineum]|uniref:Uncharacterized protein n=1 Tax=Tanacetum coccineum TaxID=301880 RepID=A0ABQ5IV66_9ASTR